MTNIKNFIFISGWYSIPRVLAVTHCQWKETTRTIDRCEHECTLKTNDPSETITYRNIVTINRHAYVKYSERVAFDLIETIVIYTFTFVVFILSSLTVDFSFYLFVIDSFIHYCVSYRSYLGSSVARVDGRLRWINTNRWWG